jgi:uncharacterized protein with HEPN domain
MPKRDVDLLIEDIVAAVGKIERYIAGLGREAFLADDKTIDAVVRNLEIIGEAARHVPDDFAAVHPEVPWQRIAGLRNRIVHDYFGLDLEIVWQILQTDLPQLKSHLRQPATGPV